MQHNLIRGRPYYIARGAIPMAECSRPISPQKVILNNKTFDVRSPQLQIPYQSILDQRAAFFNRVNMMDIKRKVDAVESTSLKCELTNEQYVETLPTDLAIQ
jgi:hypothetical protein